MTKIGEGLSGEGRMAKGKEMGRILAGRWEGGIRPVGACGRLKAAGVRVMTILRQVGFRDKLNFAEE